MLTSIADCGSLRTVATQKTEYDVVPSICSGIGIEENRNE
jgi:hypothetical protein